MEGHQATPPRDELRIRRLLQPRQLSLRIPQLIPRFQPQAERRGTPQGRCYWREGDGC